MVQNSYTFLISAFMFILSLVFFVSGLAKKNKPMWITALIFCLAFGGYILMMILIALNGGM